MFVICLGKYLKRQLDLAGGYMSECIDEIQDATAWLRDLHGARKSLACRG